MLTKSGIVSQTRSYLTLSSLGASLVGMINVMFLMMSGRHPCGEKPSVVADIGLRLSEGIQELKLDQQLAPAREAVSRTIVAGSTGFFKAVEGVRGRWAQRTSSSSNLSTTKSGETSRASTPVEITKTEAESLAEAPLPPTPGGIRPLSLVTAQQQQQEPKAAAASTWGISSFLSSRWSKGATLAPPPPVPEKDKALDPPETPLPTGVAEVWQPRDLDAVSASRDASMDALEGKSGEHAHVEPAEPMGVAL